MEKTVSDSKPVMAQDNFVAAATCEESAVADFSSDAGALAYANSQLDTLIESMRYALEKQVTGWPAEDRELNTHEALRHLLRNISFGHAAYVEADYENPTLTKMSGTNRVQFQLQSPDCNYHTAVLHGNYRYRLRGYRGTSAVFQTTVYNGHACDFVDGWKMISNANNFDTPAYAPGATVDIVLSHQKPGDLGNAHWLELPEGRCELHLRQYYADWETEKPADLILTHEGQTFPSALLTKEIAEVRFKRLVDLLRVHTDFYRAGVKGHLDADPHDIDEMKVPGAFEGTSYFNGHFRCRPDQAVIIEIDKPYCQYWNVAINQLQWEPGDYWARLVSYNMAQVHPEPDGRVRWVASWTDPGVPNWFDCSGRLLHLIAFRFFKSSQSPSKPRLETVPFAQLSEHVPADTPRVTPQARQDLMTRRLVSVYRRRFNDF
ncbi:MAG: DUF1214 domain-containing protein [Rhodospirillaceae bacterium]|nr:MAG: DUF1214 domain-containing protein [Rhodospirillaceae bacterium]